MTVICFGQMLTYFFVHTRQQLFLYLACVSHRLVSAWFPKVVTMFVYVSMCLCVGLRI